MLKKFYKFIILPYTVFLLYIEALQYFSRLGVFDVDDILLNTFGVFLGLQIKRVLETRFRKFVVE
ncbi:VanZ family protein [Chryseobacterium sp. 2TAF14]|uniref:VanZ family protein n=1 Tax=Chryseobacterium sp. 2TAF14 TaxID=3233007 RepID=UPI003F8DEE2D